MPSYTLYYFNGRGRAEILRMMFAAAGVPFVDKRFEFSEWDLYRNDMPGMCLPCLEMDGGYRMPETMAICRYLAREFGFYGRSTIDMFTIDYICDCFYEIMHDYLRYHHWMNGRFIYNMNNYGFGKMTKTSNYNGYMYWRYMNTCNRILPFLERTLSLRKGGNHYFLGEQLMWCDMMCYCCLEGPYIENPAMFSKYPKMMALWRRVATHPKVFGYLKVRCSSMW